MHQPEDQISRDIAARALGCSYDTLRRHPERFGEVRIGKNRTYNRELVEQEARKQDPAFDWNRIRINAPTSFHREAFYSITEIAQLLHRSTRNLTRKWYLLPGACKWQGQWYVPKLEVDRALNRNPNPTRVHGLAKLLGIKTHSLDDFVREGRLRVRSRNMANQPILDGRSVIEFTSINYPDKFEVVVEAFASYKFSISKNILDICRERAGKLVAQVSGETHYTQAEFARLAGYAHLDTYHHREALNGSTHKGRLYLRIDLADALLAKRLLSQLPNPTTPGGLASILGTYTASVRKGIEKARLEILENKKGSQPLYFELAQLFIEKEHPHKSAEVAVTYTNYMATQLVLASFPFKVATNIINEINDRASPGKWLLTGLSETRERMILSDSPEDISTKAREYYMHAAGKSGEINSWLNNYVSMLENESRNLHDKSDSAPLKNRRQAICFQLMILKPALEEVFRHEMVKRGQKVGVFWEKGIFPPLT